MVAKAFGVWLVWSKTNGHTYKQDLMGVDRASECGQWLLIIDSELYMVAGECVW